MTKNEIDFSLALAIGYPLKRVRISDSQVQVFNGFNCLDGPIDDFGWQHFDHTSPDVIWPIAEKFDAFPMRFPVGTWWTSIPNCNAPQNPESSPATATASAVIRYVKGKK